ncbi:MAG: SpoIIE family protein phosphatase, partial [Bacteroidota bacterium]
LLEYISSHSELSNQDKQLGRLTKKVDRELEKARFKEERASKEKRALSILLEETIRELENQNQEMIKANKKLLVAEEELRQNQEELRQSAERLRKANLTLEIKVQERTQEVELKNNRITSSINYARRIQQATLPDKQELEKVCKDAFVYYRPRDIVSGDFYFFQEVKTKNSAKYVIAAVDGTGHGVPGAFISLIGRNLLHEITAVRKITDAKEIIEALDAGTIEALHQEHNKNQDGMDLALCVVDPKAGVMDFVGAKNPLLYVQNGEYHHIKGSRFSIGGTVKANQKKVFEVHRVSLNDPTTVYIFTDGFQDQFGGENEDKFMVKQFREFIYSLHDLPMKQQQEKLHQTLESWMCPTPTCKHDQVDDILVMGFNLCFPD